MGYDKAAQDRWKKRRASIEAAGDNSAYSAIVLDPTGTKEKDLPLARWPGVLMKAAMFLAACAKVGLIAMIDEATGYQNVRASDALQMKLKLFLADEMRKWEKTFPLV